MSFHLVVRLFFLVLLVLGFIVGRRVVSWVETFAATAAGKRRARIAGWLAWVHLNVAGVYFVLAGIRTTGGTHHGWTFLFLYPYFAWLVTSLGLSAVLTLRAIAVLPLRAGRWWRSRRGGRGRPSEADRGRREFLARSATAIPAALLLASGYGIYRAQREFDWFEPELKLPGWPKELEGLRILQISDIHAGHFMPGGKLAGLIADINRRPADLLVLTGDIVDHNMAWFPECMEALRTLKIPRYGAFVCVGNHDYYSGGAEEILAGMQRLGMTVVRDSHVPVRIGNATVTLAGVDYPMWAAHRAGPGTFDGHLEAALAGRNPDAPVILLSHHPHAFDDAAARGVALTLSGHTHGGQFALPLGNGRTLSLGDLMFRYVAGTYRMGDSLLYVNRGIGNWFPMRLGAPPEVTRITVG